MKITKNTLNELGVCPSYLRTFMDTFPESDERFEDGVEVTAQICVEQADNFDWSWAAEVMLTGEAYQMWRQKTHDGDEVKALLKERDDAYAEFNTSADAWCKRHDHSYASVNSRTSEEAAAELQKLNEQRNERDNAATAGIVKLYARDFGELFESDENRSDRFTTAVERSERTREASERMTLHNARNRIAELKAEQERWTNDPAVQLARIAQELPEAEQRYAKLQEQRRQREVIRAQARVATAKRALEVAQQNVANAQQQADELVAAAGTTEA